MTSACSSKAAATVKPDRASTPSSWWPPPVDHGAIHVTFTLGDSSPTPTGPRSKARVVASRASIPPAGPPPVSRPTTMAAASASATASPSADALATARQPKSEQIAPRLARKCQPHRGIGQIGPRFWPVMWPGFCRVRTLESHATGCWDRSSISYSMGVSIPIEL